MGGATLSRRNAGGLWWRMVEWVGAATKVHDGQPVVAQGRRTSRIPEDVRLHRAPGRLSQFSSRWSRSRRTSCPAGSSRVAASAMKCLVFVAGQGPIPASSLACRNGRSGSARSPCTAGHLSIPVSPRVTSHDRRHWSRTWKPPQPHSSSVSGYVTTAAEATLPAVHLVDLLRRRSCDVTAHGARRMEVGELSAGSARGSDRAHCDRSSDAAISRRTARPRRISGLWAASGR